MAIHAVRKGAAAEGMKVRDYVWRGHDPTAVAVMTEVIAYSHACPKLANDTNLRNKHIKYDTNRFA